MNDSLKTETDASLNDDEVDFDRETQPNLTEERIKLTTPELPSQVTVEKPKKDKKRDKTIEYQGMSKGR